MEKLSGEICVFFPDQDKGQRRFRNRPDSRCAGLLPRNDGKPQDQMQQTFCAPAGSAQACSLTTTRTSGNSGSAGFLYQQRHSLQRLQFAALGPEACRSQVGFALVELAFAPTHSRNPVSICGRIAAGCTGTARPLEDVDHPRNPHPTDARTATGDSRKTFGFDGK
jgi:hypothetical protein